MDELMEILRGIRVDADQAIQLLASGQHNIENAGAILDRIRACRNQIDRLINEYGDPERNAPRSFRVRSAVAARHGAAVNRARNFMPIASFSRRGPTR
jgi:hypothetical protein